MRRIPILAARLALLWERAAPLLVPPVFAVGLFAALALAGLWDAVGDPWRAIAGLIALAAAAGLSWRASRTFRWPSEEDAARRVEEDSGIRARPHEALTDTPAGESDAALWRAHRVRMAARLTGARARRPKAAWALTDRWGARGALLIVLVGAWAMAGPLAGDRLGDAFSVRPILRGVTDARIDAWLDPPTYTGRAPIFLRDDQREAAAPAGSVFAVRVAGVRRAPSLYTRDGVRGETDIRPIGDGVWEARTIVAENSTLELRAGGARTAWRITAIPDRTPVVRIIAAPETRASGDLAVEFTVEDDYGAVAHALEIRPADEDGDWDAIDVEPGSLAQTRGGQRAVTDTAQHRLAGARVELRVTATDAADNTGRSPAILVTLPERVFLDPLARAVAEQRRVVLNTDADYADLAERAPMTAADVPREPALMAEEPERRIERAPEGLQGVARALDAVTDAPEYYFDDPIVYLALREALHRLRRARDFAALGALEADLWEIALRAELGSLADAEAALRAAERALMEALARGADDSELAPLFESYREAMENYLAALAREAAEAGRFAEGQGGGGTLDREGLDQLLQALRDAAELGDTADARRALQQLSELLRNLEMQLALGGGGSGDDPISEAMREALEELSDVIGEQRELQDQTFGMARPGGQPQQPGPGGEGQPRSPGQGLADSQGGLADRLGELAQGMTPGADGEDALSGAGEAMRDAAEALRRGDAQAALDAQEQALQSLRESAEGLAQQLMERQQAQQTGAGEGQTDPLGRPRDGGGFSDGEGVEVPDEIDRQRARRILDELRRRAGEQDRPADERSYIERLLERFGN